jgi:uncharacterized protein YodC (DUF2158 family)
VDGKAALVGWLVHNQPSGKEEVMSEEIQKGDVVQLKGGGPAMAVQDIGDFTGSSGIQDGVLCVWIEGKKKHSEVFDRATLRKYERPKVMIKAL